MLAVLLLFCSLPAHALVFEAVEGRMVFLSPVPAPANSLVEITRVFHKPPGEKEYLASESQKIYLDAKEMKTKYGLVGARFYANGKVSDIGDDMNFYLVTSERDECGYKVPRVELELPWVPEKNGYLVGPDFVPLKNSKDAEKRFAAAVRGKEDTLGHARAFFTRAGATYVVADVSEMGTRLLLYRLDGKKIKEVGFAEFPPCGS